MTDAGPVARWARRYPGPEGAQTHRTGPPPVLS